MEDKQDRFIDEYSSVIDGHECIVLVERDFNDNYWQSSPQNSRSDEVDLDPIVLPQAEEPATTNKERTYTTMERLALWCVCNDESQYEPLRADVFMMAMDIANRDGLKIKRSTLLGIASAAIFQAEQPLCRTCLGLPYESTTCPDCNGLGKIPIAARKIASFGQLNHKSLRNTHKGLYEELVAELNAMNAEFSTFIKKELMG